MEDINLHFTGDFHAVSLAHNLLAALIDNHIHFGHQPALDTRRLLWKRVVDLNDRSLRNVTVGLGGVGNGTLARTDSTSSRRRRSWPSCAWPPPSPT